jgi:hypothetical protein
VVVRRQFPVGFQFPSLEACFTTWLHCTASFVLEEEESKRTVVLAQQNSFGPAFCVQDAETRKSLTSVDCLHGLIAPCGLLSVVSYLLYAQIQWVVISSLLPFVRPDSVSCY